MSSRSNNNSGGYVYSDDDDNDQTQLIIDASMNRYCWIFTLPFHCGFCPYSSILKFRTNDVVERYDKALCGERIVVVSLHPGENEFGNDKAQPRTCCCLVCVDSNDALGTFWPSFGCDREAVNGIIHELNERTQKGDYNAKKKWQLSERVASKSIDIQNKLEIIVQHMIRKDDDDETTASRSSSKKNAHAPISTTNSMIMIMDDR